MPKPPEPPKVAIVGNGPSATSRRYGQLIDKCSEVIRINEFKLKGYTDYVGAKTTTWAHSQTCKLTMPDRVCSLTIAPRSIAKRFKGSNKPFMPRQVEGINWPSTGLVVLNSLIKQGITPYVIGFDAYNPSNARRYWEDGEWDASKDPHDSTAEAEWLHRMSELRMFISLDEVHDGQALEIEDED